MRTIITLLLLQLVLFFDGQAQSKKNDLVQFSGVIVSGDSLQSIPYASIMIRGTSRGTISDYYGFYSFVAKMNDTVEFAAIGYKRSYFVIPDTLTDHRCSLIQILKPDTILLKEVVIFPWPTKEQFKEAFIRLRAPYDDLTRAERNLDRRQLDYLASITPMDGSMNFKWQMQQQTSQLYYAGQLPPNNLLNPVAWAKFVQMWQNGEFKSKDDFDIKDR
ncbi:MAG: carboxypeptidase-like regulatory domain-containing protein [Bacteroidota bacterium]